MCSCINSVEMKSVVKATIVSYITLTDVTPYMALWLSCWIPVPGVPCPKPLGDAKVDSAFHPSKVNKMSTRNFWELNGKK